MIGKTTRRKISKLLYTAVQASEMPVLALFIALFIYFSLRTPNFAEAQGLLDIARIYTPYAILAVGLTLVIGSGGIDISVGSVLGLASVVLGVLLSQTQMGLASACGLAVAVGALIGAFNGWAVAYLRMQPVVVTLSTMAAARGLAYVIAGQGVSSIDLPERAAWLEDAAYISPAPMIAALLLAAAGSVVLTRTTLGRAILAIGSSEEAARLSGIAVRRVKLCVYAITGALAGFAGVLTAGMMYTATTEAGMGYEFEAITAVLIGGTSITGGEATVGGSILGVMLAAVLNRGLDLMGINDLWRMMCLGVILIVSVVLDMLRRRVQRTKMVGEEI